MGDNLNEQSKKTTKSSSTRTSSSTGVNSTRASSFSGAKSTRSTSSSTSGRSNSRGSKSLSAEEKLKKSMKGLSYTGSSATGVNMDILNQEESKPKVKERKKIGGVVLDMGSVETNKKENYITKRGRNSVIILILSLLLVASLVYLLVAIMGYYNNKKEPNCKFYVQGEAQWIIEGKTRTEFLIPQGLMMDMAYELDSSLTITTNASVNLTIEISAMVNGTAFRVYGLNNANQNLERIEDTNTWKYKNTITGGGTFHM
ncbi:MAG: hypothetical protein ACLRFE_01995, partial [Clostridia bacterium]